MPPKNSELCKTATAFCSARFRGGGRRGGRRRRTSSGDWHRTSPGDAEPWARAERGGIHYALWAAINHHPLCLYQRIAGRQSRPRGRPRDRPRTWAGGSRGQSEGASETGEKRMGQPYGCELFRVARIWDCALCSLCAAPYGVCPCWLLRVGLSRPDGL